MKRHFVFASTVILDLAALDLFTAQSDPFVELWRLKLAKSKPIQAWHRRAKREGGSPPGKSAPRTLMLRQSP